MNRTDLLQIALYLWNRIMFYLVTCQKNVAEDQQEPPMMTCNFRRTLLLRSAAESREQQRPSSSSCASHRRRDIAVFIYRHSSRCKKSTRHASTLVFVLAGYCNSPHHNQFKCQRSRLNNAVYSVHCEITRIQIYALWIVVILFQHR